MSAENDEKKAVKMTQLYGKSTGSTNLRFKISKMTEIGPRFALGFQVLRENKLI